MKQFITCDSGVATFLIYHRHRVTAVPTGEGKRLAFHFPDGPDLRREVDDYLAGAKVSALEYENAHRIIRAATKAAHRTMEPRP
jgi:hypothetical protein